MAVLRADWLAASFGLSPVQKHPGLPRLLKAPLGALVQLLCIAGKLWQPRAAELLRWHHLLLAQLMLADSCRAHTDAPRNWQQDAVCSCLEFPCTTCCPLDNDGFSVQSPGAPVAWGTATMLNSLPGEAETCAGTNTQTTALCTSWHKQTPSLELDSST